MVIGCPGSGKSTLSKKLAKKLDIPLLHLDYIYHIDNFKHITRDELKEMVTAFATSHERFIIDGNYNNTLEWRTQFCDTVVLLDIDTDICVENVLKRMSEEQRDDMAPGFDNTIMDDDFLDFVKGFKVNKLPHIKAVLDRTDIHQIVLSDYDQMDEFLNSI